jgi:hypothetical protein
MTENITMPTVSFDLDDDSVPDTFVTDTNADGIPDQTTTAFDLDDDSAAWTAPAGDDLAPDDGDLDDDSFTPPEHITDADLGQAMQDVQHTQAMNQYMHDCGVIS